jgi:hypothetical protein
MQVGLLVGAIAMIYMGYEKFTQFRDFKGSKLAQIAIGISIITLAYVIIKTLTSMFIE